MSFLQSGLLLARNRRNLYSSPLPLQGNSCLFFNLLGGGMCVMPLPCGNLPAQRNKMESLADTSQSECWEMQTTGKGAVLTSLKA